jgi:hypothetical protein
MVEAGGWKICLGFFALPCHAPGQLHKLAISAGSELRFMLHEYEAEM